MNQKPCDACHEWKQLTHRVTSEILKMEVCYECGIRAELLRGDHHCIGDMTITLFERPKVIPMFFECSVCHDRYTGEQQYAAHWYEKHA
jgi:hypothetical protein